MDNLNYEKLAARIRKNEGLSYLPYRCSAGALTIGYGHNLDARGISIEAAELLLKQDLEIAEKEVKNAFIWWPKLDDVRLGVLIEMCYNLGISRLVGFKKMLSALEEGDYKKAAKEMLDSKWAFDVKGRARELAEIMQTGEWE